MRILQISSAQQFGGGERHLADLCRSLAEAGHELHIAVRPKSPLPELVGPAVSCHELPLRGALDLVSAYRIAKLVEETGSEIVHAHYARDYPVAASAVRYCRFKGGRRKAEDVRREAEGGGGLPAFFITRHHYLPIKSNPVYRRLLGALDCAIAVSESVRDTLARSFGYSIGESGNSALPPSASRLTPSAFSLPPFPIEVIPNWIDPTEFSLSDLRSEKYREEFGLELGRPAIGVINQISEAKGQATLLRAVAWLKVSHPDLQIIFAGREHSPAEGYTLYLKRLSEELGLSGRVIFAGHVTRLRELFSCLDLVAIPSENEAFSIVCLEAMSARRLVIASAVGGLAELIEHEKTGLLFPVGDSGALANRIALALDSPLLCRKLVEAAYESVEKRFSRTVQIARLEQLYREAVARRRGREA